MLKTEESLQSRNALMDTDILICDDQEPVLMALRLLLEQSGCTVSQANGPAEVLNALDRDSYKLLILDLNYSRDTTSGREGLELISQIRARKHETPILIMTAWGSMETVIAAMRAGANDFIMKPWSNEELTQRAKSLVRKYLEVQKLQLMDKYDREEANAIQGRLIGAQVPSIPGLEIAVGSKPLKELGGDYLNIVKVNDRELALSIADVSGKGVPGALIAAGLRTAESSLIESGAGPGQLCKSLNRTLQELTNGKFVTFFHCRLNLDSRNMAYCSAGHLPPLLVREDGSLQRLSDGGPVLGIIDDCSFDSGNVELRTGDRLIFFTDGLTEACGGSFDEFGEERLCRLATERHSLPATELHDSLFRAAMAHCEGKFQDDASLLVIAVQ